MDEETMDVKKRSSSHGGSTGSGDGARDDTGCDGQAWRAQVTNPRWRGGAAASSTWAVQAKDGSP